MDDLKWKLYEARKNTDYMSALYMEEKIERNRLELEIKGLQKKEAI